MTHPRRGFPQRALLGAIALAAAGSTVALPVSAAAQTLAKEDFKIRIQRPDGDKWVDLTTAEAETHFNLARCQCAEPVRIIAELSTSGIAKGGLVTQGTLRMFVGTNCLDKSNPTERDKRCQELGKAVELTAFTKSSFVVDTTVNVLVAPKTGACDAKRADQTIWLWVDFDPNDDPDLVDAAAPTAGITVDTEPPQPPVVKDVAGGNEALIVSWSASTTTMDLAGYQIFCSRGEETPVFEDGTFKDTAFETKATLCGQGGGSSMILAAEADGGAPPPDAGVFPAYGSLKALDARFVCSNHLAPTQTSNRISILQNGIPYMVGVVAVDRHGNPSALPAVFLQTPVPSKDFYRGLCEARRADGKTEPCPSGCAIEGLPGTGDIATGILGCLGALALTASLSMRRRRARC